jgi:phenylacetate-CoA ligase
VSSNTRWLCHSPNGARDPGRKLSKIVRYAAVNVPYYRDLFSQIGFDPEKLTTDAGYFRDIPYLTKDIIRTQGDRLLRHDHATARKHVPKTGGSTGPSALIFYDQDAADWSSATTRTLRAGIGKKHFHSELNFASRFSTNFRCAIACVSTPSVLQ